jgi:hypothetical protein
MKAAKTSLGIGPLPALALLLQTSACGGFVRSSVIAVTQLFSCTARNLTFVCVVKTIDNLPGDGSDAAFVSFPLRPRQLHF